MNGLVRRAKKAKRRKAKQGACPRDSHTHLCTAVARRARFPVRACMFISAGSCTRAKSMAEDPNEAHGQALWHAAQQGRVPVFGATIVSKTWIQRALQVALFNNHAACVRALLAHMAQRWPTLQGSVRPELVAEFSTRPNLPRRTPLTYAVFRGSSDAVQVLLDLGAGVDQPRYGDRELTPLHVAAAKGHVVCAQVLMNAHAHVDALDKSGVTPLAYAVVSGHAHIVTLLCQAGADVDLADTRPWSKAPLWKAACAGRETCVQALICAGADVNQKGGRYRVTPLCRAASKGHLHIVQALLSAGANVNQQGKGAVGVPIIAAAQNRHMVVVHALLSAGADVNVCDGNGSTPLHCAAAQGQVSTILALVRAKADVDSDDDWGTTPIFHAAEFGHRLAVRRLIQLKADIDTRNDEGESPLDFVNRTRNSSIARLLLAAGARRQSASSP